MSAKCRQALKSPFGVTILPNAMFTTSASSVSICGPGQLLNRGVLRIADTATTVTLSRGVVLRHGAEGSLVVDGLAASVTFRSGEPRFRLRVFLEG